MTNKVLEHAVNLIKSGDIDQGRKILVSLLKENQKLERAWVWLYACVKTDAERIYCLKKVLELNPNHERAKTALEKLTGQKHPQTPAETESKKIASQYRYQMGGQNREQKPNIKIKGRIPLQKKNILNKTKIKVVFIKPKVIFNKPNEKPFKKAKYPSSDFPDIDTSMFGNTLTIGGIHINIHDYPKCIPTGRIPPKSQCYICEFFTVSDCPIRRNPTILRETRSLFVQNKRYWQENRDQRDAKIDAIYSELKAHGRPLHYEIISKIMKDRYPKLRLSAIMILHFMGRHPEKFEWVDVGVFKAR